MSAHDWFDVESNGGPDDMSNDVLAIESSEWLSPWPDDRIDWVWRSYDHTQEFSKETPKHELNPKSTVPAWYREFASTQPKIVESQPVIARTKVTSYGAWMHYDEMERINKRKTWESYNGGRGDCTLKVDEIEMKRGQVTWKYEKEAHKRTKKDKKSKDKPRVPFGANTVLSDTRMIASHHSCDQMKRGPISTKWAQGFSLFHRADFAYV